MAIEEWPESPRPWMELALVYEANGEFSLAERCYERATDLDPSVPQCWYHLALVRAELGDIDGAAATMARAAELERSLPSACWRIGFWRLSQRRLDDARLWFDRALAIDPADIPSCFGLARTLLEAGDPERSIALLEPLRTDVAWREYASFLLVDAYRRAGREVPGQLLDAMPDPSARRRGLAPDWADPWAEETRYFRRAYGAKLREAVALLGVSRFGEAIVVLEDLHRRRPDDLTVLVDLGVAYRRAGRVFEAREVLEAALAAGPDNFAAHLNLAAILLEWPDHERAIAHAERAVELNPTLAAAHETLGRVLMAAGRREEAQASLRRARELKGD
jgi:tetratricopeptide (TPR) repeat protein